MTRRWRDLGLATLGLVALLLVPLLGASSAIRDFIMFAMAYGLLAMSLILLIVYTGLVSFGHAMFFASGAYAFGLAMQSGKFSIPAAFALAIVFTAVLALVIGAICVRLNEIYFAFLTLAFQMLIYNIILGWVSFTGGDQGLMGGIPRPKFLSIDSRTARSSTFSVRCCSSSAWQSCARRDLPFGYTLRLIRDNQERRGLGIDVARQASLLRHLGLRGLGRRHLLALSPAPIPTRLLDDLGEAIF
jgi:branched-chain amino acid transport system permease protein